MLIEAENRLLSVVEHWLPRIDVAGIPSATAKSVIATVVGVWENWLSACSAEGERHADMAAQALALRRMPQSAGRLLPGARHGHAVHGWVWSGGGRPVGPLRPDFGSAVSAVVGAIKRRPELSGACALVGMAFGGFLAVSGRGCRGKSGRGGFDQRLVRLGQLPGLAACDLSGQHVLRAAR
jgi:hypothetical protein